MKQHFHLDFRTVIIVVITEMPLNLFSWYLNAILRRYYVGLMILRDCLQYPTGHFVFKRSVSAHSGIVKKYIHIPDITTVFSNPCNLRASSLFFNDIFVYSTSNKSIYLVITWFIKKIQFKYLSYLSICLSVCLSIYLSIYPSIHLSSSVSLSNCKKIQDFDIKHCTAPTIHTSTIALSYHRREIHRHNP
jgi:hypothetical protein